MNETITVLAIEDEASVRRLLEYNLKLDGFEVHLAEDGPTGLALAREIKPGLILLDVMMPGMDGLEVLLELKNDPAIQHIPVFMLTAKGKMADVERAYKIGADNYITKPFDPEALGTAIKNKLANLHD